MRKILTAIFSIIYFYNPVVAQDKSLIAQGATPDLYLEHVVLPKENYYSVGRMYNIPPKDLGTYNHLVFEKGLSLGQTIRIPLTQNNFLQGDPAAKDEALIPIYHIVQPKEGLYRIGLTYNKVSLESLKKWNNLPGDIVSNGTKLIIGYLKVLKEQSPLAQKGVTMPKTDILLASKEQKKEAKTEVPKEKVMVQPNAAKENVSTDKPSVDFSGGFFKKLYSSQADNKTLVKENGIAGAFKTTSGWTDGKYYCFHNDASPGTVIKITNNVTGKSVYAKVLDAVPDIRQNNGLLLRLSNSAAEELGSGEAKFDCSISYSK